MADGFTILPAFGNSPGAFTEVLTDNENAPLQNYWRGAEMDYRNKVFEYQKRKAAVDNILQGFDFNTAGTAARDLPYINSYFPQLTEYVNENPEALDPTSGNPESIKKLNEFNRIHNEGRYYANKSKLDNATRTAWMKQIVNDPLLKPHAAEYLKQVEDWWEQGGVEDAVTKRGEFELQILPDDNPVADAALMDAAATMKDEEIGKPQGIGMGLVNVPKTTPVDVSGSEQVAQFKWQNNPDVQAIYQGKWDKLGDDDKAKFPTPYDYFLGIRKALMKVQPKTTNEIRSLPDSGGSGTPKVKLSVDYETEIPVNFKTTAGKIQSANSIGGYHISKNANAPANILIGAPKQAYDGTKGEQVSLDDIGAKAWNVDVIDVLDWYVDPKTKRLVPKQNVNSSNRSKYDVQRFTLVNRSYQSDAGTVNKTYLIPFDENISVPLANAGIQLNAAPQSRTIVRTGMKDGKKVVQYSDGTIEYAN